MKENNSVVSRLGIFLVENDELFVSFYKILEAL